MGKLNGSRVVNDQVNYLEGNSYFILLGKGQQEFWNDPYLRF